jgi:hypothetical protein
VAARAAQRLAEREGRPKRVLREPRPGEAEEIDDDADAGGPVDGHPGAGAATGLAADAAPRADG